MTKQRKRGRPPRKEEDPQPKGSSVRLDADLSYKIGVIVSVSKGRRETAIDKASYVDSLIREQVNRDYEHARRKLNAQDG